MIFSQADLKQFAFAKSHLLLKVDKVVVGELTLILLKGVRVLVGRVALPLPCHQQTAWRQLVKESADKSIRRKTFDSGCFAPARKV